MHQQAYTKGMVALKGMVEGVAMTACWVGAGSPVCGTGFMMNWEEEKVSSKKVEVVGRGGG